MYVLLLLLLLLLLLFNDHYILFVVCNLSYSFINFALPIPLLSTFICLISLSDPSRHRRHSLFRRHCCPPTASRRRLRHTPCSALSRNVPRRSANAETADECVRREAAERKAEEEWDPDLDDELFFAKYREQRVREMLDAARRQAAKLHFTPGEVRELTAETYVRDVLEHPEHDKTILVLVTVWRERTTSTHCLRGLSVFFALCGLSKQLSSLTMHHSFLLV